MKFSIILPCYNVTQYLTACMDSLFANDLSDSEIILVNDGSKDDFAGWCRQYFACDMEENTAVHTRIWKNCTVKIISQPNRGVSAARNTGLEHACGEYVLFVDPDDTVTPDYMETICRELSGNGCDLLLFGYWQMQENAQPEIVLPKREYSVSSTEQAVRELLPNFLGDSLESIGHWLKTGVFNPLREAGMVWRSVYRRRIISTNHIRFREDIRLREDDIFHCEYISCIQTAKTCMKPLYVYNLRNSGAVRKKWGNALLENELALLNARSEICAALQSRGFAYVSDLWFLGSAVFAAFSILRNVDASQWKQINRYILHPVVRKAIHLAPLSMRKIVYCVMILLLKLRLHGVLLLIYKICGKLQIRYNLCR